MAGNGWASNYCACGASRRAVAETLGQVADIDPDGDFGFILTNTGGMLYFHRNSVLSGEFEKLERGDQVYYVEKAGDTGPTASKVRVKGNGSG